MAAKELEEKSYVQSRREFDSEGRVISQITYRQDGKEVERETFTFDETGFLIEETKRTQDEDFTERIKHEKGGNDQKAFSYRYYADGSFDTTTYTYDDQDRLVELRTADSDDEEEVKEVYEYPEAGLQLSERYDWEELSGKRSIRTGEHGMVERKVTDAEGDVMELLQLEYNDAGKLVASTLEEDGERYEIKYELDDQGRPVKELHNSNDNNFQQTITNQFDDNGHLIHQQQLVNENGKEIRFARRYDYEWPEEGSQNSGA